MYKLTMKTLFFFSFLMICQISAWGQVRLTQDRMLEQELYKTGLIHRPLAVDTSKSYEARGWSKNVLDSISWAELGIESENWSHQGIGNLTFSRQKAVSGSGSIRLSCPTYTGKRAVGPANDPDYATYGNMAAVCRMGGKNLEAYNRLVFYIYPDCEGSQVVNMNLTFVNADTKPKKGYNAPSGSHLINLVNKQWNRCFLEIDEYQRDKVVEIGFSTTLRGKDRTTGDSLVYYIDGLQCQTVEFPDKVSGWIPAVGKIVYSTTGYSSDGPKTAIMAVDKGHKGRIKFNLADASTGELVFSGESTEVATTLGRFQVLDFTSFDKAGEYLLKTADGLSTHPFRIGERIWEDSQWRVLNYIFCQRCGYAVPGKHGACHADLVSKHNGRSISYSGGWHDAGDLSQQTLQTGDVMFALLEAYNNQKDKNPALAARLREEAEWGLEFILKNRYGDGYHASSMGLLIWQDGITGTWDDISSVRTQNFAFDNFLYAAYESYAAMTLQDDPMLQNYLRRVAEEDFSYALQKFEKEGFDRFAQPYEHTYNTSKSQYMATISWAASMLYKLTGKKQYAEWAAHYIQYALDCQRVEPLGDSDGICGFFYRDKARKSIVHNIHQSREQVYMQALELLCQTQKEHPDYARWNQGIRLYGNYLKKLMKYVQPYGMLPSGVYHAEEYKDSANFYALHLFPPTDAPALYKEQLERGVRLDKEHYIKRFPVWFNIFNGNTAVHLSTGKAAAICGRFLNDAELLNIGREQLYWTVGKNPFGQSLIYGEGYNYPQMNSFSSGEMVGEMPVGIRTLGNDDIPYWPQTNNACYKEVWVTSAGKWLSLLAEY